MRSIEPGEGEQISVAIVAIQMAVGAPSPASPLSRLGDLSPKGRGDPSAWQTLQYWPPWRSL